METKTQYDDLKYNELKSLAAKRGLDSKGTKEEITERLVQADKNGVPQSEDVVDDGDTPSQDVDENTDEATDNQEPEPSDEPVFKPLSKVQDSNEQRKADRGLRTDAQKMKAHLDKQQKVSIIIQFDQGENPVNASKIPFHINMNGYKMDLPRGQYIDVPMQVAQVIKDRQESEGKIGKQWRTDSDQSKMNALS